MQLVLVETIEGASCPAAAVLQAVATPLKVAAVLLHEADELVNLFTPYLLHDVVDVDVDAGALHMTSAETRAVTTTPVLGQAYAGDPCPAAPTPLLLHDVVDVELDAGALHLIYAEIQAVTTTPVSSKANEGDPCPAAAEPRAVTTPLDVTAVLLLEDADEQAHKPVVDRALRSDW